METMNAKITPTDARDLLGYFNLEGGVEPSGFKHQLITAIICADPENRARLALGFPGLVAAFESQDETTASIERLRVIARGYERPS